MTQEQLIVNDAKSYFQRCFRHIDMYDITDKMLDDYLHRDYVRNLPFIKKMDLLYDYILSNNLVYVTE